MTGPQPQLVALLLCEQAFQQAGTGNWCVIGAFDTINAPELPFTHPQFTAFVAMSDFVGHAPVEVVIRGEEGNVVKAVRGQIPRLPLGLFQYAFPFPAVHFTQAGVHTAELLADGKLIALRSFRVLCHAADPDAEARQAQQLTDGLRATMLEEARAIWAAHPDARPIGLIASSEATAAPWFRAAFERVFGAPPPALQMHSLVDPGVLQRLLGDKAAEAEAWFAERQPPTGRALPVVIVTQSGVRFALHRVADD